MYYLAVRTELFSSSSSNKAKLIFIGIRLKKEDQNAKKGKHPNPNL